jgi:V/A-type H+/Na+-transporting ATPase subunit D
MIHPTRTNLLILRDKARSVVNSMNILKARKQALIKEFLDTTRPFLRSRAEIRNIYCRAIQELRLSLGHEGKDSIESIAAVAARDFRVEITENSIWGLRYKEVAAYESAVRDPGMRGYDYLPTSPHLEEGIYLFEKVLESMVELAAFENKLKRLGEEIIRTTRKIRAIEERVLPGLRDDIRKIVQYIGEREREAFYRLKRFKSEIQSIPGGPS